MATTGAPMMSELTELQKLAIAKVLSRISGEVPRAICLLLNVGGVTDPGHHSNEKDASLVVSILMGRRHAVTKSAFADVLRTLGSELGIDELSELANDVEKSGDVLEQRGRAAVIDSLREERALMENLAVYRAQRDAKMASEMPE